MKKKDQGKIEIESQIRNVVPQGELSCGTVVYKAFVGSEVKITVEVETVFDPASDTIPAVKQRAKNSAVAACERFVRELDDRGYF